MIDFTNCKINKFRYYGGKNGGKIWENLIKHIYKNKRKVAIKRNGNKIHRKSKRNK